MTQKPFDDPVMTSQLVLCKISLNDYNSGTRVDIKKRLMATFADFDSLSYEKIKILVSYTLKQLHQPP